MSYGKPLDLGIMNCINLASKKLLKFQTLCVLLCGLICFTIYLVYVLILDKSPPPTNHVHQSKPFNQTKHNPHVLCVLVPFRDRFDELLQFVPHLSKFLNRQSIKFHIAIINHLPDGEYRFNKGATFNAGFHLISRKFPECDYISLHDIDTLPLAPEVSYAYPGNNVYHGIPPGYHPVEVYSDPTFIGGILLMPKEIFIRMNGYGNNFWGWGFEDIDFYRRMQKYSVSITRPEQLSTNKTHSFKHIHGETKVRDMSWCLDQAQAWQSRHRTDNTGVSNVDFTLTSEHEMTIDGFPFSVFNIIIKCNFNVTPWCKPNCVDKPATNIFDLSGANNNPFRDSPVWRFMNQMTQMTQVSLRRK